MIKLTAWVFYSPELGVINQGNIQESFGELFQNACVWVPFSNLLKQIHQEWGPSMYTLKEPSGDSDRHPEVTKVWFHQRQCKATVIWFHPCTVTSQDFSSCYSYLSSQIAIVLKKIV